MATSGQAPEARRDRFNTSPDDRQEEGHTLTTDLVQSYSDNPMSLLQ